MAYYETSSSEEEDTPSRKKTKTPGGTAGTSNLADECVPFTLEDYPGELSRPCPTLDNYPVTPVASQLYSSTLDLCASLRSRTRTYPSAKCDPLH